MGEEAGIVAPELAGALRRNGLTFSIGPFATRLQIALPSVARDFLAIYDGYPLTGPNRIVDYHLRVGPTAFHRRWIKPDAKAGAGLANMPFVPLPAAIGILAFESSLNWLLATSADAYLVFHAGIVARGGRAVLMPGTSGTGKSTLTAGLAYSGWRLLSDEFALLRPETSLFYPYPRPISLKNRSIAVMRERLAANRFSRFFHNTPKGTIVYLRPSTSALAAMGEPASPALILFPEYRPEEQARAVELRKVEMFALVRSAAVNCDRLGATAFAALGTLVERCRAFRITYRSLDQGMTMVEDLMEKAA